MEIIIIIIALSVVQSIFGLGLLVFGTPTLLLLGYSFADTLGALLPASASISAAQTLKNHEMDHVVVASFLKWAIIPLMIALYAVLSLDLSVSITAIAALMLWVGAILRLHTRAADILARISTTSLPAMMLSLGVVHGLSNLGGSILSVIVSGRKLNKAQTQKTIAFCYLVLSIFQLSIIYFASEYQFRLSSMLYPLIALSTYLLIGVRVGDRISEKDFGNLFTVFMLVYAALLTVKAAGVM